MTKAKIKKEEFERVWAKQLKWLEDTYFPLGEWIPTKFENGVKVVTGHWSMVPCTEEQKAELRKEWEKLKQTYQSLVEII